MKNKKIDIIEDLYFLKVPELRLLCQKLRLAESGKKEALIDVITQFLTTGSKKVISKEAYPLSVHAQKGTVYHLSAHSPILYGAYKNDAQTRAFMKKVVGNHFYFTVFGQDWIKHQWSLGKAPTYQEFASFWQQECAARKHKKAQPKKEWALLNFIQQELAQNPLLNRVELMQKWKVEQAVRAKRVFAYIDKHYSSI